MPYEITYRNKTSNGNPITITSSVPSVDIEAVNDGDIYEISVIAISSLGVKSPRTNFPDYEVIGKTLPPANVTGFSVVSTKYGNYVSWNPNVEVDLREYEIRKGLTFATSTIINTGSTSTSFTDTKLSSGIQTYWIRAQDTTNHFSLIEATGTVSPITPTPIGLSNLILGKDYELTWQEPSTTYAISYYEIRYGATWGAGVATSATTKSTIYQQPILWGGSRIFHVAAVDIAGNISTPATISISISSPVAPNVTHQIVDNNVLLYWTDAKATLPVDYYEIRRDLNYASPNYSTATVIGTKAGLFTVLFETTAGQYLYYVVGIDSAGNYGTQKSILTTVNQPPGYILTSDYNSNLNGGNLLTYSSNIDNAVWSKINCTTTANSILDPNGALTVEQINRTAVGNHFVVQTFVTTSHANNTYTFSVWLSKGSLTGNIVLRIRDGAGTEIGAVSITPTSDLIRYSVTGTFGATPAANIGVFVDPVDDTGSIGDTFFMWGAQLEKGSVTTKYTATVESSVIIEVSNATNDLAGVSLPHNLTETWQSHFTAIRVLSLAIVAGGAGYAVNDTFRLNTGTFPGTSYAVGKVTAVSAGAVTAASIVYLGWYTVAPTAAGATIILTGVGNNALTVTTTLSGVSGWATPQEQLDDSFSIYAQPSEPTGFYQETKDYGGILAANKITITLDTVGTVGTPIVTPTISASLDSVTWTDYIGTYSVYATNFRYVKIRIAVTSIAGIDLLKIRSINIKLDSKIKDEADTIKAFSPITGLAYTQSAFTVTITQTGHGRVVGEYVDLTAFTGLGTNGRYKIISIPTADTYTVTMPASNSTSGTVTTDATGTPAFFKTIFTDVSAITTQYMGTTVNNTVLVDFVDVPNPTYFKVLLYNSAGTPVTSRTDNKISWSTKGF